MTDPDLTHCGNDIDLCESCEEPVCDDCGKERSTCTERLLCVDCALGKCVECAENLADDLAAEIAGEWARGVA